MENGVSLFRGQTGEPIQLKGYWSAFEVREGDAWKDRIQTWNITSIAQSFCNFAYALLAEKQAEKAELFNDFLPAGSIPGINNRDWVPACMPVVKADPELV
jgi:hypothetical protein